MSGAQKSGALNGVTVNEVLTSLVTVFKTTASAPPGDLEMGNPNYPALFDLGASPQPWSLKF